MASLWESIFESSKDRGARLKKETAEYNKSKKKKKKKSTVDQTMRVAPTKPQPNIGNTVRSIRKRQKYLDNI